VSPGHLLAITGGHRYDVDAFAAMFDAVCARLGWRWTHAEQPAAQQWLAPEHAGRFDAIVLHDLPGLQLTRGAEPRAEPIDPAVEAAVMGLLDAGQGIVATHHALAGWPTCDAWATVLGGRFLYAPGTVRGVARPPSGYRFDQYRVLPATTEHPVCAGVTPFDLTDELYLCPVFEGEVEGLLTTDADLSPASMIDTYDEVVDGVRRPADPGAGGSNLLGWAKSAGRSPLVYLLPGHSASTMEHRQYRRLLANAVEWVASADAHAWARVRR
jgi:type 1 glutamine amidotransferase